MVCGCGSEASRGDLRNHPPSGLGLRRELLIVACALVAWVGTAGCHRGSESEPSAGAHFESKASTPPLRGDMSVARRAPHSPSGAPYSLTPGAPGPCCECHGQPSCAARETARAVCSVDPYCCEVRWDGACHLQAVKLKDRSGARYCPLPAGANSEPCCTTHKSTGCSNAEVAACVGALDPYCVTVVWDGRCTSIANGRCNAGCKESDSCCQKHPSASCADSAVARCVSEPPIDDTRCGTTNWDTRCVLEGISGCASGCPSPAPTDHGCCTASTTGAKGCSDPAVQNCVCRVDSYCCDIEWDDTCVKQVGAQHCSPSGAACAAGI